VSLPPAEFDRFQGISLVDALMNRRSRRRYKDEHLKLEELAFLLFATQGVQKELKKASLRPPASAGARHAFELYVAAFRVEGLEPGLYRYLPFDHELCFVGERPDLQTATEEALYDQGWNSAVTLFWTAIPYRMEWRYTVASPKLIAMDAGHSCQNLYLACEAIGCGTCAIGAYDQARCDTLLGVDGVDELTVYAAPVGKV
jgi:SagB-type dehydrogenase family enzyme